MIIFIPTMGRVDDQRTLNELKRAHVSHKIILVTPKSEKSDYETLGYEVIGLDDSFRIADTRQWIVENSPDEHLVMIDDDLLFFKRACLDDYSLAIAKPEEIQNLIDWVDQTLNNYAHCSVSSRHEAAQVTNTLVKRGTDVLDVSRPYRFYAFNRNVIVGEGIKYTLPGVVNTMDDFHITMSLFELGYPNCVHYGFAHDQRTSNCKGGASVYRDLKVLENSAKALHKAHPNFVKLVQKTTKSSWGGTPKNPVTRTDVICQWKKSYCSRSSERRLYR